MTADTILISNTAQRTLVELATRTGQSPTAILDAAVEEYRQKVFFEAMNSGYAAMRSDAQAWADEQASRRAWDATNADRLLQEPIAGEPR